MVRKFLPILHPSEPAKIMPTGDNLLFEVDVDNSWKTRVYDISGVRCVLLDWIYGNNRMNYLCHIVAGRG